MRSKSRELMHGILEYIDTYFFEHHDTPSNSEIADAMSISRSTAYKYLVAMSENGMLDYSNGEIMTAKMRKVSVNNSTAPILGSIVCGSPEEQEEYVEEYVTLPQSLFGKGEFFILRAYGESMIDAGISPGDLVVIRKQQEARDGDIVVALVDNSNTLKRFYLDEENHKVILHPENKAMDDMIYDEVEIQGVAVHVIKALN